MVIAILRILSSTRQHAQVLEILRSVLGPTQILVGCLGCHLYEEDGPDQAAVLVAEWETEEAMQTHVRSDLYRRILAATELSKEPPEFRFYYVSETQEMDLVRRLRGYSRENLSGDSGA